MESLLKILLLFFLLTFISYPQQTDSSNLISTDDSLKVRIYQNSLIQMQIKFDEFELHREFKDIKMNIPIDSDPNTVWLRTSLAVSSTNYTDQKFSTHFLSPLEKQYLENSKFNPLQYALGMVQAGAVGYLAYRHIKKYGFFK